MRAKKCLAIVVAVFLAAFSAPADADIVTAEDGWHSWQTDEANAITEACCFSWQRGARSRTGCNLDGQHMSYMSRMSGSDCEAGAGPVQYYVLMKSGRPQEIRVLSSECPVETKAAIAHHGIVSARDNVAWFRRVIEDRTLDQDVREEALFGLVQSESRLAFDYLDRLLSKR